METNKEAVERELSNKTISSNKSYLEGWFSLPLPYPKNGSENKIKLPLNVSSEE